MVFLDDNPFERNLVRQMLPQVAVPELPDDPALYTRTLAAAGYFETVTFSDEDRQRADMYQHNTQRTAMQKTAGDIDAYLASLDMEITFAPFDRTGRVRVTQLINKSNQFNLTTRRYTEAEVTAAEEDSSVFTLQVRLADRFGDNGMISVVICRPDGLGAWDIDTWLMSCRVLGRKVEHIVLRELLLHARSAGVTKLIGRYCPTKRNSLVCDHYRKLGFAKTLEHEDGTTVWQLPVGAEIEVPPIRVRRCDLASAANVGL
jgi:FkbH-like protein